MAELRVGIITSSDSCAAGEREDLSGRALTGLVQDRGWTVCDYHVCADDRESLSASIIEIANEPMAVLGNANLEMLQAALRHWSVVTYDGIYDRRRNRLATMDFCVHQPRQAGLQVNYLTRGVMTFHIPPELGPTTLQEQWRLELEDARFHQPDRLWFMGADCRMDGLVCSHVQLPQWGFPDGRTARLKLLDMAKDLKY